MVGCLERKPVRDEVVNFVSFVGIKPFLIESLELYFMCFNVSRRQTTRSSEKKTAGKQSSDLTNTASLVIQFFSPLFYLHPSLVLGSHWSDLKVLTVVA